MTLLEGLTPVAPTGLFPYAWLLIAVPLVSAAILLLAGKAANSWGHYLGTLAPIVSFVVALALFADLLGRPEAQHAVSVPLYTWIATGSWSIGVGLLIDPLSILFALGAYMLVERSGERVAVIGTAKDISWGEVITQADLVQVLVAQDPALRTVPWSSAGSIVGQRAALDLPAGALLTGSSVQASTSIPPAGQALVGVRVSVGQVPSTALSPGDQVVIVRTSGASASATDRSAQATDLAVSAIPAEVFSVSAPVAGSTDRTVDVLVDDDAVALRLAAMSAAGEASIVLLPRQ